MKVLSAKKLNMQVNGWKGILSILIVLLHFEIAFTNSSIYFRTCYLAVECFLIISGYFLMKSLSKSEPKDISAIRIIKNKIEKIYPSYFVILILNAVAYHILNPATGFSLKSFLVEAAFLGQIGFLPTTIYNGPAWYISAMFIAMFFIIPLYKKTGWFLIEFIAPAAICAIYYYFFKNGFQINFFRAIAALLVGMIVYDLAQKLFKYDIPNWLLNFLQLFALAVFINLVIKQDNSVFDLLIVPVFSGIIILCLYPKSGIIDNFLGNILFQFLGNISMTTFLIHHLIITIYTRIAQNFDFAVVVHYIALIIITIAASALFQFFIKRVTGKIDNRQYNYN